MPKELPIDISSPDLNIEGVNTSIGMVARLGGTVILALKIVAIPLLVLVGILIYKWLTKKKATPQSNIYSDLKESAARNKRPGVKKVMIWDGDNYSFFAEYNGHVLSKGGDMIHINFLFPKSKTGGILPSLLSWLPAVVFDLIFERNFILSVPKKAAKFMNIMDTSCITVTGTGVRYNGNTRSYSVDGHLGFRKAITQEFLDDTKEEFVHQYIREASDMLSKILESNPFVKAKILEKREMEEGEDGNV